MTNYTNNKHALYGMMSKRDSLIDEQHFPFYVLRKNKKKVVLFPKNGKHVTFDGVRLFSKTHPEITKINLNYLPKDNFKSLVEAFKEYGVGYSKSSSNLLVSEFDEEFFHLRGKGWREIRETRNSLSKSFTYKVDEPAEVLYPKVVELVKWWDEVQGKKYGWQRHSGYDKTFFEKVYPEHKDEFVSLSFYDKETKELVGYSVVSKNIQQVICSNDAFSTVPCLTYIIRKCKTERRNTTLFIDFKTFEWIHKNIFDVSQQFYINWGASSGGVLSYKRKFPINTSVKVYFVSIKTEELEKACE